MPDGDFLQSDKKRDGLLARAGSRFEEFRQQLGRIFEAAEAKKQTKDAKMQAVLAIAEADIKRLQEQARPIDEMVTQAKKDATLLGVHLSLRNVMGEVYEKTDIPEATREKIQAALKVFRSGLVEVLGEEKRGIEQTPSIAQALKEELGADKVSIEGEVMGESADEPQALEEPAAGPAFLERKGPSDAIKYRDLLSKLQKKFDSLSAFGDSPSEKDQAIVKALSRLQECTEARELYEGAATMDARNAAWERVLEFEWSDIAAELKEYTREVTKDRDAQVKVKERTEIDTKSRLDADTRLAIAEELQVFIAGEGDEMPEKKRKKAPPKRDPRELKPRTPGEREIANAIDQHFNGGEGSVRKGATIVEVKGPNVASKIETNPDTIPPASGAPPAMPPAPLGLPPLPTFAHPDLFRQGDRSFLEGWLKDQQTRLGYVRNMIAEPALTDARKRHPSFDVHAGRFEKVIEATEKLTQASTEAERLSAERALQDLREQGPWPIGSAEALAGLKEQQTYAQENLGYYKAANSKSEKIKEAIAQAKAKLEEVNADIYLMELDAQLEQALSEVTLLKDEGKKDELGERIATNEQKAETRETDWKKVAAESEEAQTKFIAAMETREIYDESEPTFGPIFTAFQREQEATIDLNKALRQFNVLDATETRITQTLRLLDREGSGPVSEQVWAAMPGMVRVFLRTVHEDQNSTVGNIKARLYERLRGITQDKIEANKELQQTAQLIEGLREKSSYVLALNAYQKMERETKELKNALHSLKGELEEHNPATAKKTGDRVYFIEKTQELTARYELLQNQYERKQSLLQDAQGLVELSQKALWGQAQQLDEEATVTEASAYKALEAQADIANGLIKIIEGQKLHKNKQASQEVREAELRKSLPSQPTVVGGANVFGRGGGEQTNRTSGGAKEEPSFWQQAQKWPGVGSIIKGGKDLLSAFGIDLN